MICGGPEKLESFLLQRFRVFFCGFTLKGSALTGSHSHLTWARGQPGIVWRRQKNPDLIKALQLRTLSALSWLWSLVCHNECHLYKSPFIAQRQTSVPFVSSFICRLCSFSVLYTLKQFIFVINDPCVISASLFLSFLDCEEATPVHLWSVHPSSVPADACQLPRDDLGDCERARAQDPLRHGQAHPFPQSSLERSLCICPICHLSSPAQFLRPFLAKLEMFREGFWSYKMKEVKTRFFTQWEWGTLRLGVWINRRTYGTLFYSCNCIHSVLLNAC